MFESITTRAGAAMAGILVVVALLPTVAGAASGLRTTANPGANGARRAAPLSATAQRVANAINVQSFTAPTQGPLPRPFFDAHGTLACTTYGVVTQSHLRSNWGHPLPGRGWSYGIGEKVSGHTDCIVVIYARG
jgi:hypothetical protein